MMPPVFAVVGHVNKGKSSIVATLAEDDSVEIAREAGTTHECREFSLRVDGETLFKLIDTPGFEQARRALDWMKRQETSAAERPELVKSLVKEHQPRGEFPEECKLLQPILDGAGILYVVDGSRPFSPEYEAEMEILRWTGRPRMALINTIGEQDHVAEWRASLDQYFSLVREFDAHAADFEVRISLLNAFRELREEWRPSLDRAIANLQREYQRRRRNSARAIADMLADQLGLTLSKKLPAETDPEPHKAELEKQYLNKLRQRERLCRDDVERIFQHEKIRREESELNLLDRDLFSEDTWLRLGLTRQQLATSGMVGGAAMGAGIDLAASAGTFMMGTLIGGALGGVSGWLFPGQVAKTRIQGVSLGGKLLQCGPMKNRQFPWIVLDRALLHYRLIWNFTHARRDELVIRHDGEAEGIVSQLPGTRRRELDRLFDRLRRAKDPDERRAARDELAAAIEAILGS